jgi:RNA polymerase sigma-70 factor (ECF subfamily)
MQSTEQQDLLQEPEIIRRILLGETALFEILIKKSNSSLYKTGMIYGFSHHDVEDLMQETYINAYTNLAKFEHRSSFKTWIIKIMLHQCYHKTQKFSYSKEKPKDIVENENSHPMFSSNSDTNKTIMNRELTKIIQQAIIQIPVDYRMVFSLREINGLTSAETAEALDISQANVKVRLNRAKAMLRKQIERMYTGEEIFEYNLVHCDKMVANVMSKINRLN